MSQQTTTKRVMDADAQVSASKRRQSDDATPATNSAPTCSCIDPTISAATDESLQTQLQAEIKTLVTMMELAGRDACKESFGRIDENNGADAARVIMILYHDTIRAHGDFDDALEEIRASIKQSAASCASPKLVVIVLPPPSDRTKRDAIDTIKDSLRKDVGETFGSSVDEVVFAYGPRLPGPIAKRLEHDAIILGRMLKLVEKYTTEPPGLSAAAAKERAELGKSLQRQYDEAKAKFDAGIPSVFFMW